MFGGAFFIISSVDVFRPSNIILQGPVIFARLFTEPAVNDKKLDSFFGFGCKLVGK